MVLVKVWLELSKFNGGLVGGKRGEEPDVRYEP